ncbi:LAGLIDADG family homing endonuclease [Sutcliffiella deserti]|uniref:LAGLIDADG family homing endonuclease n=1 Tax=Sutcliffiella deserti TaxID=2875501 RepID=UPI001CBDE7E0|nr:LAGLIDADG family homing endonuclease [Sutcliffiella deserti]
MEAAYIAGIIDGEGSITLSRMHISEFRRPCITISSTDYELLEYIRSLAGGTIINKKNYNPEKHKDSFTLNVKIKSEVFLLLEHIYPFLRVNVKRERAKFILENYNKVTKRNGKYNACDLKLKLSFEDHFFKL